MYSAIRLIRMRNYYRKGVTKMPEEVNPEPAERRNKSNGSSGGAAAKAEPSSGTVVMNSIGMEFACVPAGSFHAELGSYDKHPVH